MRWGVAKNRGTRYGYGVRASADRFRDEALTRALDQAVLGERSALYDRVRRACGLPGPRLNTGLVQAFAAEVARRGPAADALVAAMLAVHEDAAPYGHVDEILPILGAAATGARAARDAKARRALLETLEEAACDRRSRVRDEVSRALVAIGIAVGPSFSITMRRWIEDDQPYLGRAAISAMSEVDLLVALGEEATTELVEVACVRIEREHRAGRRHDAFRKLVRVMETMLPIAVGRHPTTSDVLCAHAATEDEDLRDAIAAAVEPLRKGRFADRAQAIADALALAKKPSRDPRWDRLPGKRGRGKR